MCTDGEWWNGEWWKKWVPTTKADKGRKGGKGTKGGKGKGTKGGKSMKGGKGSNVHTESQSWEEEQEWAGYQGSEGINSNREYWGDQHAWEDQRGWGGRAQALHYQQPIRQYIQEPATPQYVQPQGRFVEFNREPSRTIQRAPVVGTKRNWIEYVNEGF